MIVTFCFYLLLNKHAWRPLLMVTTGAALVSIISNAMLIPLFGFVGAGITSIVVHVLLATILLLIAINTTPFVLPFAKFARLGLYAIALGLLLFVSRLLLVNEVVTLVGGILGLGVAGVLAVLTRIIPKRTLRAI